jgi:hypothetical protein
VCAREAHGSGGRHYGIHSFFVAFLEIAFAATFKNIVFAAVVVNHVATSFSARA